MGNLERDYSEYNKEWDNRTQKIDEKILEGVTDDIETGMYACVLVYIVFIKSNF